MNNDSVKTVLAFVGGAIAGAAIGILLAPDKGSETRKKIASKAKDLGNDLSDAAMDKYDEFLTWKNNLMSDAEDSVKKAGQNVKSAVNQHLNKAETTVRNGMERAENKLKQTDL